MKDKTKVATTKKRKAKTTKERKSDDASDKAKPKKPEKPREKESMPVVLGCGVSEDVNAAGLRRGKKKPTFNSRAKGSSGAKAQDLMDDANVAITPFFGNAAQALFGVFDGYAGPEVVRATCKHLPLVLRSALRRGALRSPARG